MKRNFKKKEFQEFSNEPKKQIDVCRAIQRNKEAYDYNQSLMKLYFYEIGSTEQLFEYYAQLLDKKNRQYQEIEVLRQKQISQRGQVEKIWKEYGSEEYKRQQITSKSQVERQTYLEMAKELEKEIESCENQLQKYEKEMAEKQKHIKGFTQQSEMNSKKIQECEKKMIQNQKQMFENQAISKQLKEDLDERFHEKIRLNNQLQQKRGNIRVYCRVRPFLKNEESEPIHQVISDSSLRIRVPQQYVKSQNNIKDYAFQFQQIFDQRINQQAIFAQLSQLIHSAIDGKNVCVFAYGQTGSGKTFTMQGECRQQQFEGIIPRSIKLIFSQIERAKQYNWKYTVLVDIKEVYLENVINLLQTDKKNTVSESTKHDVSSLEEVQTLLDEAHTIRKVAGTNCNERSSRSHLIFTLELLATNTETLKTKKGSLNLIDLAGSERVNLSKVEGDRLKETQSINRSLSHLGDVISALIKKQSHIPFRNSKLTFILQQFLSGDSKTLMFVNISPKASDFNQTIASLRFADKVKSCKINYH